MPRRSRPIAPLVVLAGWLLVLVLISWLRWGNPVSDPGLDLVVARDWLHGVVPYRDVRYWYGPLGIGGLAAWFALLGSSLATAFAYGLTQTLLIAGLCWALARRWLPPWPAAGSVAVTLSIGFSGSLFNFQLPHTEAATAGLITLQLTLLALAAGRPWLAGVAVGLSALTRPEFLAFALVAVAGSALGRWREPQAPGPAAGAPDRAAPAGWRSAAAVVAKTVPGVVLVAAPVLGWFAWQAGTARLFTENLFPVEFVRAVGGTFEHRWHPYDLVSVGTLLLRGVVGAGAALALLRSLEQWQVGRANGRTAGAVGRAAAGPWLTWLLAVLAAALVSVLLGLPQGQPTGSINELKDDITRLLLPMTLLPAVAFAALAVGAVRWWRRAPSPLAGHWSADAALLAVAAACTLRAYNVFSTDVYATYYAPPAVLVATILLWRAGAPLRGQLRTLAPVVVLALAALALTLHAEIGRYRDQTVRVSSPHGSYRATQASGPQIQGVVDYLAGRVQPGEPMLVLVQEPGFHFLLGTRPALYDATFLPGTLPDAAADRAAAEQLIASGPRYAIVAARRFEAWGFTRSGLDFNQALVRALAERYCVDATFGDVANPPPSDVPAEAFSVLRRLDPGQRGRVTVDRDGVPMPARCSA